MSDATRTRPSRLGALASAPPGLVTWLPPVLAGLLVLPYLIRQNAWIEVSNAVWLLDTQAAHVRATGLPTTFLHLPGEAFYPQHLLYGGFLFSLLAYPAALIGAYPTFVIATVLVYVGIERGVTWFARNLGVPRHMAPLLGLAVVATPYLVADLYGRGAFTELVALAGCALCLGAGTALLTRPGPLPLGPAVVLVASAALVAGTHNLTLLMAALVAPVIVAVAFAGGALRTTPRRALQVLGLLVAGVTLTAAFLLPTIAFGPDTWIARDDVNAILRNATTEFGTTSILLSPWPRQPAGADGGLYAQASLILLLFPLVGLFLVRRAVPRRTVVALGIAVVAELVLIWLLVHPLNWADFPQAVQTIQFPFRLIPWLGLVGVTACALVLRERVPRRLLTALGVLVGVQLLIGLGQATLNTVHVKRGTFTKASDVRAEDPPDAFVGKGHWQPIQYLVRDQPFGPEPSTPDPEPRADGKATRDRDLVRARTAPYDRLTADTVPLTGTDAPDTVLVSQVAWSPWVRLSGDAHIVGRDALGYATIAVDRAPGGRWRADARAACDTCLAQAKSATGPLRALAIGRLVTVVTLFALLGLLAVALWHRRSGAGVT